MKKIALVAIGGNALITDKTQPQIPNQWQAVRQTCKQLADLIEAGWQLLITHGNGPQVGFMMRRNELSAQEVHTTPLDVIVSNTQGAIGYMLQQALRNELYQRGIHTPIVSLVTQVLVHKDDPAFADPSKPIGSFMSEQEARAFEAEGWQVIEDAGRGWRRVVASPTPQKIIELAQIKQLLEAGTILITVGGGGIPVIETEEGILQGVPAVIDKDRASGLLAEQLNVDLFLISTGVEQVAIDFKTPQQKNLAVMSVTEAEKYIEGEQFARGSMLPKITAVTQFVQTTHNLAIITDPPNLMRAINGETGTRITE